MDMEHEPGIPREKDIISALYSPPPEALRAEEAVLASGRLPERWITLMEVETQRLKLDFELTIAERANQYDADELAARRDTVWQLMHSRMQPLTMAGDEVRYETHRTLMETLRGVVDVQTCEKIVPNKDARVRFHIDKGKVVIIALIEYVQAALHQTGHLTASQISKQLSLTPDQMQAIIECIAVSGVPLIEPRAGQNP
jgi:hypothetical protein